MHTAYDLVAAAADRTPDHLALVDDLTDRSFTYAELMTEVDIVAAGLAARGVGRGTRFATVIPNRLEHCLLILALARVGAVTALMNGRLPPEDIAELMQQAEIAGAFVMPDADMIAVATHAVGERGPVLVLGEATDGAESFGACRGVVDDLGALPSADPDELTYIFYTSGTTGLPKGVLLNHRTTLPRIVWISVLAGLSGGTHIRTLGLAPLSHAIGFHGNFLMSLAYNGTYYLSSAFEPESALTNIEQNRISVLFTVPTFYFALLSAGGYRPERLASVDHLLWGGAAIKPDLLRSLHRDLDASISHIYGTTETMCSLYNPDPRDEPTRLRPGLFSAVRVVAFGGGPEDQVGYGEDGELLISAAADTFFEGYLNMPEVNAEKIRDGWYYTGDICTLRSDGDLELSGRVDDIIRSGGENVHPDEVEAVLSQHSAVADVGVVGFSDDYWGEMVVACVVGDVGTSIADLDRWCKDSSLAAYKRPRGYLLVDSMPRSAANKLLRTELRKLSLDDLQRI